MIKLENASKGKIAKSHSVRTRVAIASVMVAAATFALTGCITIEVPADADTSSAVVEESPTADAAATDTPTDSSDSGSAIGDETVGETNARESAESYLSFSAFSRTGLIDQLLFEGFTQEEAEYAVDAVGADWQEQAAKSADSYLSFSAFSKTGLIDQLLFEGFTESEAAYGVDAAGADWFEQAAKSAENYLSFSSFSRQGLIDQLLFEGFTQEEAEYGVSQNGF